MSLLGNIAIYQQFPSGGAFSPSDLTELDLWLDVNQITGFTDGQTVTTFTDSSGNGHTFTQGTSTARATYKTGIVNGKPVLRFDGGDYYQDTAYQNYPYHFFCVYYSTGTINDECLFGQDDSVSSGLALTYLKSRRLGSKISSRVTGTDSVYIETTPIISSAWTLYELTLDSGNAELFINSVSKGTDTYSGLDAFSSEGSYVGASRFNNVVSDKYTGDIAEIIVCDSKLGSTDQTSVRDYLDTKYNLGL